MFRKYFQRLRHQAFAVLFGIVLISACTVSAGAAELPSSYTRLQYIENTVQSYIDTGFVPDYTTWIDIEFSTSNTLNDMPLCGVRTRGVGGSAFMIWTAPSNDAHPTWTYGTYDGKTYATVSPDTIHEVFMRNEVFVYDQVRYEFPWVDPFTCGGNLWLFRFNELNPSVDETRSFYGRIYFAKIYHQSKLVRDYVPALSPSGEVGLYDLVNGTFTGSGNSMPFVAGPVGELPPSEGSGGDELDFSDTTLSISDIQSDFQSVSFNFSWNNLPVTSTGDKPQYFVISSVSGTDLEFPTFLGVADGIEDGTHSHSFDSLSPSTSYTVTSELVYNYTGYFEDYISTGVSSSFSFTTAADTGVTDGDKAIINAIQNSNKDNQDWMDSQYGSAVGDLPQDTTETDSLISGLDDQEEAYKDDAYVRFQELSSSFSGFDATVGSGIALAGTLFTRFYRALGSYQIIYTFPLLLGLAMVLIGRLGRSSIRMEREPGDQFRIDGW